MTIKHNKRAERDLFTGPEVSAHLLGLGQRIAEAAAANAPRDSGGGAASIHAELFRTRGDVEVRVSWDRRHFYMGFQELGSEHQPARPFLRPAADQYR